MGTLKKLKIIFIVQDQLCREIRHYLTFNQLRWSIFAKVVLSISQSRLSALLAKPTKPWSVLGHKVKAYYQRMREWLDKRATYGNNPFQRIRKIKGPGKVAKKKITRRRRNFFEGELERQEREEREEQRRALLSILDHNVPPTSQLVNLIFFSFCFYVFSLSLVIKLMNNVSA